VNALETLTLWLGPWTLPLGLLVLGGLLGWVATRFLYRRLSELSQRTATRFDDLFLQATRRSWLAISVLAAAIPAASLAPMPNRARLILLRAVLVALLACLTLAANRFLALWFAARRDPASPARPALLQRVAQVAILLSGGLLILDNVGVDVTTLLTALGVGSLAVALALQPTLSNLFAGIHLSVSKPIRVGDLIELEDGSRGTVVDIGWRTTKLHQPSNNLLLVPNARLSDMRLINYSLPQPTTIVKVTFGVAYGTDLRRAEAVALDVAREVQREVAGAEREHEPAVLFRAFGDSAIAGDAFLSASSYPARATVEHEFIVRLQERFRSEGIELPLPQRVVHLKQPAGSGEAAIPRP
jgi:small-conductance mechanosensitive channel